MKLSPKQLCPVHRRRDCCGRAEVHRYVRTGHTKWEQVRPGWRRLKDANADHPDGFRYRLSSSAMKKVVDQKIASQNGLCALCGEFMDDYRNIAPDHIKPKGLGGARRDDRPDNIQAVHHDPCNIDKGSRRDM